MKEGLIEARYQTLMRNIEKDKANHVSLNQLRFGIPIDNTRAKNYDFDIRKHYKLLKENHPLSCIVHSIKESEIKKTYITISENQSSLKSSVQTPKNTSMKKYGKEKLVKFKKGDLINFDELHGNIQSIGQ